MQGTFFLSIGIYGLLAAVLLIVANARLVLRTLAPAAVIGLTLVFISTVPSWDPAALTIGLFRLSLMKDALDEESWGDPDIKYYYDGVSTTVSSSVSLTWRLDTRTPGSSTRLKQLPKQ